MIKMASQFAKEINVNFVWKEKYLIRSKFIAFMDGDALIHLEKEYFKVTRLVKEI